MAETHLVKLDQATRMLANAKTLDEVKHIIDIAEAARVYARAAKMGLEVYNHAAEVKARAERKAGEFLAKLERTPGVRTDKQPLDSVSKGSEYKAVLDEMGIGYKAAERWQQVNKMPDEVFEAHIEEMKGERPISTGAMLKEITTEERKAERSELVAKMPPGKYAVILADPPWQYSNSGFDQSAEAQYPTMATDEICAMSGMVNEFSTPETVLFLWATNPLLPDALKVMDAWGYEYKTNMAWIKDMGRGKGWFLKSKHELLLIGTRANTPHPKERPDSCFEADRGPVHSRKPQIIYDIVESMYDGAKLEMFCRKPREGWASHGNEI